MDKPVLSFSFFFFTGKIEELQGDWQGFSSPYLKLFSNNGCILCCTSILSGYCFLWGLLVSGFHCILIGVALTAIPGPSVALTLGFTYELILGGTDGKGSCKQNGDPEMQTRMGVLRWIVACIINAVINLIVVVGLGTLA